MPTKAPPELADLIEWDELQRRMAWEQGDHVALVGPTKAGKTSAVMSIIQPRDWVLLLSTKPHDDTLKGLKRRGWDIIKKWPPPRAEDRQRVMLHAPIADLEDGPAVGAVIAKALRGAYKATGWCIVVDDMQALSDVCGLSRILRVLLLNARSSYVSLVCSTQRPRWVPREVWTQSTHLFIWRCNDADDLRALSGLGIADTARVRANVQILNWDAHECLYVNTRTGAIFRTILPKPT